MFSIDCDDHSPGIAILRDCVRRVADWFGGNGLLLNPDKSVVLPVGTAPALLRLQITGVDLNGAYCPFADTARLLGVTIDKHLSMNNFVSDKVRLGAHQLLAIRHIRNHLPDGDAIELARSLVIGNSTLANISMTSLDRLQRVQNRTLKALGNRHTFRSFHWLPVGLRCSFKTAVLTFGAVRGTGPFYLTKIITPKYADTRLRPLSRGLLRPPTYKNKLHSRTFASLPRTSGMPYLQPSAMSPPSQASSES